MPGTIGPLLPSDERLRGGLHVDGEHVPDGSARESAERVDRIREGGVRVKDPLGGGEGVGSRRTIVRGARRDRGAHGAADSFS